MIIEIAEIALEQCHIAGLHIRKAVNALSGKKQGQQTSRLIADTAASSPVELSAYLPSNTPPSPQAQYKFRDAPSDIAKDGSPGASPADYRIAYLPDTPVRWDLPDCHNVRSAAIRTNRKSGSDDFSEAGHIRYDSIQLCSSAIPYTKAADHLIKINTMPCTSHSLRNP